MKINNIKSVAILLLSVVSFNLNAQHKDDYNESVVVNVGFNPIVTDANKINENPVIVDTSFSNISLSFDKMDKGYRTRLNFDTIKPAKVKGEPLCNLYNLNIKSGVGFASSKKLGNGFVPLIQASYTSLRDRHLLWGADIYSRNIVGQAKKYGHAGYSDNELNVWGKKIFDSYSVMGRAYFDYDRYYYYGGGKTCYDQITNKELDCKKKDYLNSYINLGTDWSYTKLKRDNTLQHNSSFGLNYTNGKQGAKEMDLHFMFDVSNQMNFFGETSHTLGLTFDYKHAFFKFSNNFKYPNINIPNPILMYEGQEDIINAKDFKKNRALFNISPYFICDWNRFHIFAALAFVPKINGYNDFQILPTATLSTELIQNILSIYGGFKSEAILTTLYQMHKINPYLVPSNSLQDQANENLFAKLICTLSYDAQMSLELGITEMKNHPFFINAPMEQIPAKNVMAIVYRDAKRYYADFETHFNITNAFNLNLETRYQKVERNDDTIATYQPKFTASLKASYNYNDLFVVTVSPTLKTKQKALYMGEKKEIKSMFDLNFEATYNYNDSWSFFLDFENLALQKYQTYYKYPVYTFIGIFGARYRF